jgi:AcrR family transcriptional regulator
MRKQPKQLRSRLLVQKLTDATAQVIIERGLEFTTTNHIAEAAGVDIASLYQYFTDKDDLITALLEDIMDKILKQVMDYIASIDLQEVDPDTLIRTVLTMGITALRTNPVITHLAAYKNTRAPSRGIGRLEHYAQQLATVYFRQHFRRYPIENLHLRLYVVSISVFATISRHITDPLPLIRDNELIDILLEMVIPFFEKGANLGDLLSDKPQ